MYCYKGPASKKFIFQAIATLSTIKVQNMAMIEAGKKFLWVKYFGNFFKTNQGSVTLHCDSPSAISLTKNKSTMQELNILI